MRLTLPPQGCNPWPDTESGLWQPPTGFQDFSCLCTNAAVVMLTKLLLFLEALYLRILRLFLFQKSLSDVQDADMNRSEWLMHAHANNMDSNTSLLSSSQTDTVLKAWEKSCSPNPIQPSSSESELLGQTLLSGVTHCHPGTCAARTRGRRRNGQVEAKSCSH